MMEVGEVSGGGVWEVGLTHRSRLVCLKAVTF